MNRTQTGRRRVRRQRQTAEPTRRGNLLERRHSSNARRVAAIRLRRDLLCLSERGVYARRDQGDRLLEGVARAGTTRGKVLHVEGGFGYSPSVSNTCASGKYAAFGMEAALPRQLLPSDVKASVTAIAGYSWFGNQSAALGGFPLPNYLNWNAGITFKHKNLSLDLRYSDTNLSKENCFVFTGDPNAQPGGQINLLTNPQGFASNWCSATFVAKFSFAMGQADE
jgi:hypothetical protein